MFITFTVLCLQTIQIYFCKFKIMWCFLLKRKIIVLCTCEYLLNIISKLPVSTVCLLFTKNSSTTGHLWGPCWVIPSQRAEIYLHNLHLQKMRVMHIFIKQENAPVWRLHLNGLGIVLLSIHQPSPHFILLGGKEEQCRLINVPVSFMAVF